MNSILIELHCFPSLAYFQSLAHSDLAILEAQENYNKRSYRNKFKLMSDKGVQTFSIPLRKGKHQQQPILETTISYDEDWPDQLHRTLTTYYASSPFFEHYWPGIARILNERIEHLWEFNSLILLHLIKVLRLDVRLASNMSFERRPNRLTDLRYCITPKSEIEHSYYPQVFEERVGFTSNLSILDLLFALGPEAGKFILNSPLSCKV